MNHRFFILFLSFFVSVSFFSCKNDKKTDAKIESSSNNNFSYAFGILIGTNLKTNGLTPADVNSEDFVRGLKAAMGEGKAEMDVQAAQELVQKEMESRQQMSSAKSLEDNKKFLEENAKKSNIKTTASGLQYEVIKDAKGPKPTLKDKVKVHYHGTLVNGTVFDSSVERGEPITFPLNGVIQGWQEGLQLMNVGSKYRLFVPSDLGYGPNPAGKIPANSLLVFEVELLSIEK
jgi:FKBP-type peptidyl-prolyl cis-trans isomerase FklB